MKLLVHNATWHSVYVETLISCNKCIISMQEQSKLSIVCSCAQKNNDIYWVHNCTFWEHECVGLFLLFVFHNDEEGGSLMHCNWFASFDQSVLEFLFHFTNRGDKMNMLNRTYRYKALRKIKSDYAITRLTAYFMCGLTSDLVICTFRKVWSYRHWNQISLNNTKPINSISPTSSLWQFSVNHRE